MNTTKDPYSENTTLNEIKCQCGLVTARCVDGSKITCQRCLDSKHSQDEKILTEVMKEFDKLWKHKTHEEYGEESKWSVFGVNDIRKFIKQAITKAQENERKRVIDEIKDILIQADSKLSLLSNRGNIPWGTVGMCEEYEVNEVIGKLRKIIQ